MDLAATACLLTFLLSLAFLYDQYTRRIPTRLDPRQAPKSRSGLVPVGDSSSPAQAGGIDFIFVHGLGSNPDTTWRAQRPAEMGLAATADAPKDTTPKTNQFVNWVSDFLPNDLPPTIGREVRIFYYNYDSYWQRDALYTRLELLGKGLLEHIRGIRITEAERSRDLIFVGYSYGGLVVKQGVREQSSTYHGSNVRNIGLPVDHYGLNKFATRSESYQIILSKLKEVIESQSRSKKCHHSVLERLKSATIPFSRNPDFVNRENILDQIDQRCSEPAGRVALVGLGGVGKSQLAIEYAHRTAAKEPDRWVFWVHAGTQARVEEGFKAIADAVKLPGRRQPKADVPQLVYSWLSSERDRRWIVILDSADDIDVFFGAGSNPERRRLADYLPQSPNGSLLVTTRNKDLAFRLVGGYKNTIEIGPMAQSNALLLLERKLGLLSDKDSAEELVRALEYVPLAISQAAAYIQRRSPRSSVEKYLTEFSKGESKRAWLLGHDEGEFRREGGASSAILATWQISFEHIRSKRASAADLLSLMSFFDRQGIPESLLRPPHIDGAMQERRSDVQHDLGSNSSDDEIHNDEIHNDETDNGFEDNVAMLTNYCLVTVSESGDTFEMHGLVQLSTRTWLKACGREEEFKHQFVSRIAALFPPGDYSNWATCQRLFPHVERAVDYRPVEGKLEEAWATLLYNGGWYAELQGRYDVAEKMARKSRRSRKEILGREDERTLASTSLCAEVLRDKGLWKEAEKLFVQVMEIRKTKLGADHPSTLTSMANLASTYRNQGRWEEAEKLFVQVMETRKTKLGADHPDTLTSIANLASTFWNQGRWEEAENMANLASTFWNQGRWEEAEKLFVQVMETSKTKLGADHPDTLTSIANLASTYRNQGRWEEAEKLEVQVMETRKTKLGADHPSTLTSMANLASTFWNQGRWEEAEKLFVQVMEIRKTKLGADHPSTLTSIANLASTYRNQGRWEEAEKLEVQVMETSKTKLGADHPSTLTSMANLASTFWNQGRWEEAEKLFVQVMETSKTKLGADHPDTLVSMANLAFTWNSQGRHEDALALMQACVEVRQRVLGPEHPDTLSSLATVSEWSS
ncbi:hypothetical protein QBC32DRAFT_318570 [Pseudoneurospora amorphoporcata]|uniref:NB-ARC domain-containing protein n=1 Tax=Pseudoneurospora amorphoporcata TaxID=241081 RepID=A0AAN6SC99_9PEZI|nr:hypothetical protein QBC32DRAFT_318570 [Pseudoneurospora amorphoporcata]